MYTRQKGSNASALVGVGVGVDVGWGACSVHFPRWPSAWGAGKGSGLVYRRDHLTCGTTLWIKPTTLSR